MQSDWLGDSVRAAVEYAYTTYTRLDRHPIARVVERVRPQANALSRHVTLTIDMTGISTSHMRSSKTLVPILQTRRGGLLDSLEVFGPDARVVEILPRHLAKKVAASTLLVAWSRVFGDIKSDDLPRMRREVLEIPELAHEVARVRARTITGEIVRHIEDLQLSVDHLSFERLKTTLKFFANRNIVWGVVDGAPSGLLTLTYSFRVPTKHVHPEELAFVTDNLNQDGKFWRRAARSARMALGLAQGDPVAEELLRVRWGQAPNKLAIPIGLLHRAESYHLSVEMPAGTFCSKQLLSEWTGGAGDDPKRLVIPSTADYRGEASVGTAYAHLYTHRVPGVVKQRVYAFIEFREIPPGVTGVAYHLGAVITAFCMMIGAAFPVLLWLPAGSVDAAALLLAVPSLAAIWLLPNGADNGQRYVQAPVVTRIALFVFASVPILQALLLVACLGIFNALKVELSIASIIPPWLMALTAGVVVWKFFQRLAAAKQQAAADFRIE